MNEEVDLDCYIAGSEREPGSAVRSAFAPFLEASSSYRGLRVGLKVRGLTAAV